MKEAGISQGCTLYDMNDNSKKVYALAHTNTNTFDCGFVLHKGFLNVNANTVSNIVNSFVHEEVHTRGITDELQAISKQMNHTSWTETTMGFKSAVCKYAIDNAQQKKYYSIYSPDTIEKMFNYNIRFNGVCGNIPNYTISLTINEISCIGLLKKWSCYHV